MKNRTQNSADEGFPSMNVWDSLRELLPKSHDHTYGQYKEPLEAFIGETLTIQIKVDEHIIKEAKAWCLVNGYSYIRDNEWADMISAYLTRFNKIEEIKSEF